jgi:hypothetical protein
LIGGFLSLPGTAFMYETPDFPRNMTTRECEQPIIYGRLNKTGGAISTIAGVAICYCQFILRSMQSTITFIVNVIDSGKASETKQSLQLFNYSVKISALNTADYRIVKCSNTIQVFIKLKTGVNFRIRNCLKVSIVKNN